MVFGHHVQYGWMDDCWCLLKGGWLAGWLIVLRGKEAEITYIIIRHIFLIIRILDIFKFRHWIGSITGEATAIMQIRIMLEQWITLDDSHLIAVQVHIQRGIHVAGGLSLTTIDGIASNQTGTCLSIEGIVATDSRTECHLIVLRIIEVFLDILPGTGTLPLLHMNVEEHGGNVYQTQAQTADSDNNCCNSMLSIVICLGLGGECDFCYIWNSWKNVIWAIEVLKLKWEKL